MEVIALLLGSALSARRDPFAPLKYVQERLDHLILLNKPSGYCTPPSLPWPQARGIQTYLLREDVQDFRSLNHLLVIAPTDPLLASLRVCAHNRPRRPSRVVSPSAHAQPYRTNTPQHLFISSFPLVSTPPPPPLTRNTKGAMPRASTDEDRLHEDPMEDDHKADRRKGLAERDALAEMYHGESSIAGKEKKEEIEMGPP